MLVGHTIFGLMQLEDSQTVSWDSIAAQLDFTRSVPPQTFRTSQVARMEQNAPNV